MNTPNIPLTPHSLRTAPPPVPLPPQQRPQRKVGPGLKKNNPDIKGFGRVPATMEELGEFLRGKKQLDLRDMGQLLGMSHNDFKPIRERVWELLGQDAFDTNGAPVQHMEMEPLRDAKGEAVCNIGENMKMWMIKHNTTDWALIESTLVEEIIKNFPSIFTVDHTHMFSLVPNPLAGQLMPEGYPDQPAQMVGVPNTMRTKIAQELFKNESRLIWKTPALRDKSTFTDFEDQVQLHPPPNPLPVTPRAKRSPTKRAISRAQRKLVLRSPNDEICNVQLAALMLGGAQVENIFRMDIQKVQEMVVEEGWFAEADDFWLSYTRLNGGEYEISSSDMLVQTLLDAESGRGESWKIAVKASPAPVAVQDMVWQM